MTFSRTQLQVLRWVLFAISVAIGLLGWLWNLRGGLGLLCFFGFLIAGIPAAMISLHLYGAKWFGMERN